MPITGKPIDNVCPDPNLFIRNLCFQLVIEGNFRSMSAREKNRALKRWNSSDDLTSMGSRQKLEPEFVNAKNHSKQSFTDESIALVRTWSIDPRVFLRKRKGQSAPSSPSQAAKQSPQSNNLLFKEMTSLMGQSPVKLALYLTRFYLEQFQTGFDVQMLAQLVLIKVGVLPKPLPPLQD